MQPFCLNKVDDSTYPNRFPDPFISTSTCTSTKNYHFQREIVKKDGRILLCNLTKTMTATRRFIVQPQHRLAANMTQEGKKSRKRPQKDQKLEHTEITNPPKSSQIKARCFLRFSPPAHDNKKAHSLRRYYPDQVLRVYLSLLR
jgi:hypothetical protein